MIHQQVIQETKVFQRLTSFEQKFLLRRSNVEIIDHTITVYKNTKYLNENIGSKNLSIVKEILETNK